MKYKINYTLADDSEDFIIVEAETIEEIRKIATKELEKRNAISPWSEEIN